MKLLISAVILMMSFKGDAQSLSCDSNITQPLCPGTITKCTCAITSLVVTRWNFTTLNLCQNTSNLISLTQLAPCSISSPSPIGTCGPYLSAANNNPIMTGSSCPTSTLTITANQTLNGLTIECRDVGSGNPGTLIGTGTISITAPPSVPPNITSLNSNYSDQLTVTWTSVPTATSYNVSINDSVNTLVLIPSNGSLQKIFTGLTNNTVYTVSVVAINCAGSSSPATMSNRTSNGPPAPTTTSPTSTSASPQPISDTIAIGVGVGVGVGVPVLLALILVIVGVVYCKIRGGNTSLKIRNEESSPDGSHPPPSKPPRVKNSSPPAAEAPKPAAKPSGDGLVYADVNTAKGSGNKRNAPPPANDGVTYSGVKH